MSVTPYGTWESSFSAAQVAAGAIRLAEVQIDGEDTYWIEMRPLEQGRYVIVRRGADGRIEDVTPPSFNARAGVHEYGGGNYVVHAGTVYFSNFSSFSDNQLYRQPRGGEPVALTRAPQRYYADLVVDAPRNRLICVREDHARSERKATNAVIAVALDGVDRDQVLASGADFYSNPRLSPDGRELAWLQWNHPDMPWDATELWVAAFDGIGKLTPPRRVAGGGRESIFQPEWSPDGVLHFISDRSGWWNLYRHRDGRDEALAPMDAEFGEAQWVFGLSTYDFVDGGRIVATCKRQGRWHLGFVGETGFALRALPYDPHLSVRACRDRVVFVGTAPAAADAIVELRMDSGSLRFLNEPGVRPEAGAISHAEPITFPSGTRQVHAFFYAPTNRGYTGPATERPPLIVMSHGGPTSCAEASFNPKIQFWTSRGFAVVDVDYGGSTGYGRAYRERLNGEWGIVDVEDCIAAARHLVARGRVDPDRLIIRGGSAGGYTTLAALAFHDVFKAGASHYGVSDVEALARDTHKFESRYLDRLIGPYPEQRDKYRARSPIHAADRIVAPLILFQGLEDKVVPASQSEKMAQALRTRRIPVAYITFAGEQHGFRHAANIVRALESELAFYGKVFGFQPAGQLPPVHVDNLESGQ